MSAGTIPAARPPDLRAGSSTSWSVLFRFSMIGMLRSAAPPALPPAWRRCRGTACPAWQSRRAIVINRNDDAYSVAGSAGVGVTGLLRGDLATLVMETALRGRPGSRLAPRHQLRTTAKFLLPGSSFQSVHVRYVSSARWGCYRRSGHQEEFPLGWNRGIKWVTRGPG